MTSEGGTNRIFSPFLMLLFATRPRSPTSTFRRSIFWGGKPESVNHFCNADAFSSESISQPQGIGWGAAVALAVSLPLVEIVQRMIVGEVFRWVIVREQGFLRDKLCDNEGMSVVWKILEASAMAGDGGWRRGKNLIYWSLLSSRVDTSALVVLTVVVSCNSLPVGKSYPTFTALSFVFCNLITK